MKNLQSLLESLTEYQCDHVEEVMVTGLEYDSRNVSQGNIFFAWQGQVVDGRKFIPDAIAKGASVIVTDASFDQTLEVAHVVVPDVKEAMGRMANAFYDRASRSLNLIGVTGTNGKTSVTHLVQSIYKADQKDMAMITTIGNYINGTWYKTNNTTPESVLVHKMFYEMVEKGVSTCMMEVSSHALELYRVEGCHFDYGVFTNLTPDHLEFHGTMEAYYEAKRKLFFMTSKGNVINMDDEYGQRLIEDVKDRDVELLTYGLTDQADLYAKDIMFSISGSSFTLVIRGREYHMRVPFPGDIYVYNTLAAFGVGLLNGIHIDTIIRGLSGDTEIKGRFETVIDDDDYRIIIDFAHTEDSLEKTLKTLSPLVEGDVILVYGVYSPDYELGESKRDGMAKVASELADFSFVTSDNPKLLDPVAIVEDISRKMTKYNGKHQVVVDRKLAIEQAIDRASGKDLIILAGKGHEDYQYIGKEKVPFSERQIALNYVSKKKMYG